MMQIIYCECGEYGMLNGRCVGCGRVRPSSEEVEEQILKIEEDKEGKKCVAELAKNLNVAAST